MYLRVGDTIINTDHVVAAKVAEAAPERTDEQTGETLPATPMRVELLMTAGTRTGSGAVTVELDGERAEAFLAALPTYEPVREE